MKLWKKQAIFSRYLADLLFFIDAKGYFVSIDEVFRTPEQAKLYEQQGKGIANSLHCKKLAADLNIFDKDGRLLATKKEYEPFGEYWESLYEFNRWGGNWTRVDSRHFEMQDI